MTEQAWLPSLDMLVGRRLRLRDVVHVGETWERVRIPNLPKEPETVAAKLTEALQRVAEGDSGLSGRVQLLLADMGEQWRELDGHIEALDDEFAEMARNDPVAGVWRQCRALEC